MERRGNYTTKPTTKIFLSIGKSYVEGLCLTGHNRKYYLQYACPGAQYNTYCDEVYVGNSPLGLFAFQ